MKINKLIEAIAISSNLEKAASERTADKNFFKKLSIGLGSLSLLVFGFILFFNIIPYDGDYLIMSIPCLILLSLLFGFSCFSYIVKAKTERAILIESKKIDDSIKLKLKNLTNKEKNILMKARENDKDVELKIISLESQL